MSEEHPVIPTRETAGELLRKMLLQELTIGEGPIGQMDMLSILANAADWLDEAVAENATTGRDRLCLTDEEREAIERLEDHCAKTHCVDTARVLRGLLERHGY